MAVHSCRRVKRHPNPVFETGMSSSDFDLHELAAYLHLSPQQVERLVNRDQIPGRRVGGQWRFSRAEVHHWLEEQMGVVDDEALLRMEGQLREGATNPAGQTLRSLLPPEAIAVPLLARTRNSAITAMCELAAGTGLLWDAQTMAEAVRQREELHTTALENGVALLHPRRPLTNALAQPLLALGITSRGIPFGGGGVLTDVFFLICSTGDRSHLRTLARLSRMIATGTFVEELRQATDAAQVLEMVMACDEMMEATTT